MKKLLIIYLLSIVLPTASEVMVYQNGINGFEGITDGFGKTIYSLNGTYKSWYNISYPNAGLMQMSWMKS